MKILSVASPDKISLGMFTKFLSLMGFNYPIVPLHSLMGKDSIDLSISDGQNKFEKVIFTYYAKKKINKEAKLIIPEKLLEKSDFVIWFDIYSVEPKIIKDEFDNFKKLYSEKWKDFIKKIEGIVLK